VVRLAVVSAIGLAVAIAVVAAIAGTRTTRQRPSRLRPSRAQIAHVMWRTVLAGDPLEHFYPGGQPTTISDGSRGYLTAEIGTIGPTTDGDGQLIFFWHDSHFVGWDSAEESMAVLQVQPLAPRGFQVTYLNFAPDDPACCPSLIPASVVYRWNGRRFVAKGDPPPKRPIPSRVHLIP
jgi:hypothetical protein